MSSSSSHSSRRCEQGGDAVDEAGGVAGGRLGAVPRQTLRLGDQVPVVVEHGGEVPQVLDPDAGGEGEQQAALEGRVVEEPVAEPPPALLEGDVGRHLVEDLDVRRHRRLDRVLGEDALCERVQGRDRGGVELVERHVDAPARVAAGGLGGLCGLLQGAAHAVAQLRRRLLGERDRGDLAHRRLAGGDETDDALDERAGLARPRPRLDEERRVEVAGDAVAGGPVGEDVGHGVGSSSTPGSTWATYAASSSAWRSRSQVR